MSSWSPLQTLGTPMIGGNAVNQALSSVEMVLNFVIPNRFVLLPACQA